MHTHLRWEDICQSCLRRPCPQWEIVQRHCVASGSSVWQICGTFVAQEESRVGSGNHVSLAVPVAFYRTITASLSQFAPEVPVVYPYYATQMCVTHVATTICIILCR